MEQRLYTIEEVNRIIFEVIRDYNIKLSGVISKKANEYGMNEVVEPTQPQDYTLMIMKGMRESAEFVKTLRPNITLKGKKNNND